MEVSEYDPLIVWFDDALEKDFCKKIIRKFNKDDRKEPGRTGLGYTPDIKQSLDLVISHCEDWKEEDQVFFKSLNTRLKEYSAYAEEEYGLRCPLDIDTGYQMQKTTPGGFYHWHHDFSITNQRWRSLTYIWYLNTPRKGHTEFSCGESIKPETGKLVLFPATWDRLHRGTPPETMKYICTGWLYKDGPREEEEQEQEE